MLEAWFGLKDENPSLGISSYQVVPSIIILWFDEVEVVDDQWFVLVDDSSLLETVDTAKLKQHDLVMISDNSQSVFKPCQWTEVVPGGGGEWLVIRWIHFVEIELEHEEYQD